MAILTRCTLTFIDLNEIHIGTMPTNPVNNELWFDTEFNILKKYNLSNRIWEIVNDYTQDILDALKGLQVSSRNLLASTSYASEIICTGTTNKTGGQYNFVTNINYANNIKDKEITLAFDWEVVTTGTPSGTFRVQTTGSSIIQIGDITTLSNSNYYGTCVFTTKLTTTSNITGINFRTDGVTGTFRITHPRLFYGSKDLGWMQAPEDIQSQFETIINKQAEGVYISVANNSDGTKTLVNLNSQKVLVSSSNIDLQGYVTITSLSDPSSTTTIDGNLIETDTLSANKVKTGKLQGKNSSSYFNLDNGTFALANATQSLMTFNGTSLTFQNNVNYNLDKDDFSSNLDWIKNWTEGSTTINSKQVMSPRAFFGTVNASRQATGVSIGGALNKIYETEGTYSGIDDGLAGYKLGTKMFHFKTDGTLLIGPNTTGNYLSWDGSNLNVRANSINIGSESVATNTAVSTAKADAISAAASDATSKANSAQTNAVTTASADATSKANAAKSGAISTAASDATSKANAAQTNAVNSAKGYTDGQVTTINETITSKVADIKITTDAITQRVSSTESNITTITNTNDKLNTGLNKWLVEMFDRGTIAGTVPITINDLTGKVPNKTFLVEDRTSLITMAELYLARWTTNVYLDADYNWTINAASDDGGTLYLNGKLIATTGTVVSSVVLNFKQGWNKITWVYNENSGGDGCYFTTKVSSLSQVKIMTAYDQTNINEDLVLVSDILSTTKNQVASIQTDLNGITSRVSSTESTISTHTTDLGKIDGKISDAKTAAINSAASDATSKANAAQTNAISTASSDATSKANAAKTSAVSTASADATSKANAAQTNATTAAKNYTDGQVTTVNETINSKVADIKLTTDSITSRVASTESNITTHTTELGKVDGKINTAVNLGTLYVKGTGYNRPSNRVVQLNGTSIVNNSARGFAITIINRNDLSIRSNTNYDVYSSDDQKTNMTNALNALTDDCIVVLTSWDAIATNDSLDAAIARCGGTGTRFGGTFHRVPYALVGIPNIGKGSGIEVFTTVEASAPYAEINTKIVNGIPEGISTNSRELYSSISTTNSKVSTIESNLSGITSRVSTAESNISTANGNITSLTERVRTAEQKITDDSIVATVTASQTNGKNTFIQQSDITQLDQSWTATFKDGYNQGITTINKDGITVTSSEVKSKTSMSSSGFKITKTDTSEDVFKVNADGTLTIKGNITVTGGSIPVANLDGKLSSTQLDSTITTDISTAKSNSSTALSTANSANSAASTASSNASTALSTANSANTTAGTAKSTADTAKSTADTAKSTATTANSNASTALTTANTAKSTADLLAQGLNKWMVTAYDITGLGYTNSTIPTFNMLANKSIKFIKEILDSATSSGINLGDNYIGHAKTNIYLDSDYSLVTSLTTDDAGAIYLNGLLVTTTVSCTAKSVTLNLKAGWNTIEVLYVEINGGDGFVFSPKFSATTQIKRINAYEISSASISSNLASESKSLLDENKNNWGNAYNRVAEWANGAITGSTTINGGFIETNTITAKHIALGDFSNYCQLAKGKNLSNRFGTATWVENTSNDSYWQTSNAYFPFTINETNNPFKAGDKIQIKFDACTVTSRNVSVGVWFYSDNACVTNTGSVAASVSCSATWGTKSVNLTLPEGNTYIQNAKSIAILINNGASGEVIQVRNTVVVRQVAGDLIVDGTITTNHINATGLDASVIKAGTISADRLDANTIISKVNGATTTITGNKIRTGQITATTGGSYLNLDNGSMMLGATSGTSYLQWTGSALNIKASSLSISGVSAATTTNVSDAKTQAINEASGVKDTRSTNENPTWYITNYPQRTVQEFKSLTILGLTGDGTYGTLETKIPWKDSSGGYPTQTFFSSNADVFTRRGLSGTTWSEWTRKANATQSDVFNALTNNSSTQGIYLNNGEVYLNATMIKTGTLDASLITTENLTGKTITAGTISGGNININNAFKVDTAGKMIATGAEITGKITVSTGSSVPTSTLSGTVSSSQLDSSINTSINNANTSATNANNKIDNLQIGGRNLYINSSTRIEILSSKGTYYKNVANAENGFKLVSNGAIHVRNRCITKDVGNYTISFYIKSSSVATIIIDLNDLSSKTINTTTSYQKIIHTVNNTISYSDTYNFIDFESTAENGTEFYIKDFKVETGTKATDWSPALEETVLSVDTMYYLSTSSTSQAGGSWSKTLPTVVANKFIWTKTITTYAAGTPSETAPILYQPDWIQDWDSTKTTITGTSVLAPKIFAGTKETNGSATGLALGTNVFGTGTDFSGLAGYKAGTKTFHFKTDGTMLIGQNTTGNYISWDGSNLNVRASSINIGTENIKTHMDKINSQSIQNSQNIRCNNLGIKINYSTFSTSNTGELYLHGYDANNNPTDTNGSIYWNGIALTVTKGMINPDANVPINTEVFIFINKTLSSNVYGTYYNTSNKTWSYITFIGGTGTVHNFTPDSNHIAIGQLSMIDSETFNSAYLYETPQSLTNLTIGSMNLVSRMTTVENKTTDNAIISTVSTKFYNKDETEGSITSKGYQTSSQVQQTVDNFKLSFTQSGGTNLLKNSAFKNGQSDWTSARWDMTAGGTAYIEVVYPEYNEWTPSNRNSLGACITGIPASSAGIPLRCGFDTYSFNIKPSTTYTLNCLMASHRIVSFTIEMLCFDSSGNRLSDNNHSVVIYNPKTGGRDRNNWDKIKHTWTTQSNAATCYLRAYMNEWSGLLDSAYMWICEPIITEGDVDLFWTPNADEVYTGIVTLDNEGVLVDMIDGATSKGYSRLSSTGIETYDSNGTTKSWFSDSNAYIKELTVENINNPYLIQSKHRVTNWYVGQYATGDKYGRDTNNKSNSINSILQFIKDNYGCYSSRQDISIFCDNGMSLNENIYIGGWIGTGIININFGSDTTFTGSILVEECTMQVILDGRKNSWETNNGCMWWRTDGNANGVSLYVRHSSVICTGFRAHNNYSSYGYSFVHAIYGSNVCICNLDLIKFWSICSLSDSSIVYIDAARGDVGILSESSYCSTIIAQGNLPIFNNGKSLTSFYNSVNFTDGGGNNNSLWYPKDVATPTPTPTQSWHWVEKTFYFNLSSTTEGTGSTTSGWSDKWGQGKWGNYKPHRGHAIPTESISSWFGSNSRNFNMVLTMTRLSVSHGYGGAVPIPKIKQKDGSYWSSGVAFALGNTKSITLSGGIVGGLADGTLSELTMWAGTSTNDYSQYNNVSLTVSCEKYY